MRVCESQAWLKPVKRKPREGWSEKFEGGGSVKPPKTQYAFTHDMLALKKKKKKKKTADAFKVEKNRSLHDMITSEYSF